MTYFYCSVCGGCGKDLKIRPLAADGTPGEWEEVGLYEFCEYLVSYNRDCGDCLEIWSGGGGK